jgi:hypothetical protein
VWNCYYKYTTKNIAENQKVCYDNDNKKRIRISRDFAFGYDDIGRLRRQRWEQL